MRINTKCSIAIHSLILINLCADTHKLNSETIARSTGCNPVIIRNLFRQLQDSGIIRVTRGAGGGACLNRPPEEISILDIYLAVEAEPDNPVIGIHLNPEPLCPVGAYIHEVLEEPYRNIEAAMQEEMKKYSLHMLTERIKRLNAEISGQ